MAEEITNLSVEIRVALRQVRSEKAEVRALAERARTAPSAALFKEFLATADQVDEQLLQNRGETGPGTQSFLLFQPGLLTEVSYLLGEVDGAPGPLRQPERDRLGDLKEQWATLRARAETLAKDLPRVKAATGGEQ